MLRNRFTKFGFLLLLSAVTTVAIAAPPPGKGKGGGDDGGGDPPTDPPPLTYMLTWIDDFTSLRDMNNDGDLIGEIPSLVGTGNVSSTMGLVYGGERYVLDDLFADTEALPRYLFGLSNRLGDGSVYLCGSCDTVDGVRGWRMKVSPATNGLEPVSFSILQPAEGDDTSALTAINIHGESVGYSYSKSERAAIGTTNFATVYDSDVGTSIISETGSRSTAFISDSGVVVCPLEGSESSGYSCQKFGRWSLISPLQILLDAADFGADSLRPVNFSANGDFLFEVTETIDAKKGTETIRTTYLYNGTVNPVPEPSSLTNDLNSLGDLIISGWVDVSRNRREWVMKVYFAGMDVVESLDNMIDESNSQEDVNRWFSSSPGLHFTNDSGVIAGSDYSNDVEFEFSVVLVPVLP